MPGLIGKKLGMTSTFNDEGKYVPCTLIEAGPCVVTQLKTKDKDGYDAVQLGFGERREKSTTAAQMGHFKKSRTTPKQKVAEFIMTDEEFQGYNLGDEVKVDVFQEGQFVDVVGYSKGKGFQGVVKRHNFSGVGDMTHGQHDRQRHPGSLGGSSDPSRVFKGMRMAGRTGGKRVTFENLQVVKVLADRNIIVLKGSVPGPKGSFIMLEK